jgi:hypothetical protein
VFLFYGSYIKMGCIQGNCVSKTIKSWAWWYQIILTGLEAVALVYFIIISPLRR